MLDLNLRYVLQIVGSQSIIFFIAIIFLFSCPTCVLGQDFIYLDQEDDERVTLRVTKKQLKDSLLLILESSHKLSEHSFSPAGYTHNWHMVDKEADHDFLAKREKNEIFINGKYSGGRINKVVKVDGRPWINKLDHGLSKWVTTEEEQTTFWTLKLGSGLDPVAFEARKAGTEKLRTPAGVFDTIKVKINLEGFLVSNLWSADLWYREKDGLFIKYSGDSGPGTSLRVIELQKIL